MHGMIQNTFEYGRPTHARTMQCILGDRMNAPGCRSIQLSCVRSDMFQSICIYPPCYIRVAISALRRGLGAGAVHLGIL